MVSSYVYDFFKDYLDKFLFDFDRSQLTMSVLSGNVTLKNVNLRPDELNDFFAINDLPLTLKAGFANKLTLTFSVISFHTQPIEIEFDGLSLVFGPSLQQMSRDASFLQKRKDEFQSARNDNSDDCESSYDSMNAFNVHSHGLRDRRAQGAMPSSQTAPHRTWQEHQKFLQKLKLARVQELRTTQTNRNPQGLADFDFNIDDDIGGTGEENENSVRSTLNQLQLIIKGLHIRFEEDYFSSDKPYSIGLVADYLSLTSSTVGQELWHFPEFLKSLFESRAASQDPGKQSEVCFKDVSLTRCKVYVNSASEIYVPTQLYQELKHLPNQIFETLSMHYLSELMAKRQGLNFIIQPVDLVANFGDATGTRFFLNIICGKIQLQLSEPILSTIFTFKKYLEDFKIVKQLKQFRPQRRPLVESELAKTLQGRDVQEQPERLRQKRKLLVRDWFFYVVWYVRLRNVERKTPTAWSRLCKASLVREPDRYRDLIRAAFGGMQTMRDYLVREEKLKRLEHKERADFKPDFPFSGYSEVVLSARIEHIHANLYEKAIQVGIGLPLYELNAKTIAFEKHLEMRRNKLASRIAVGQATLRQIHTLDSDLLFNPSRPMSSQRSSVHGQTASVLSKILRNERKMTALNRGSAILSPSLTKPNSFQKQEKNQNSNFGTPKQQNGIGGRNLNKIESQGNTTSRTQRGDMTQKGMLGDLLGVGQQSQPNKSRPQISKINLLQSQPDFRTLPVQQINRPPSQINSHSRLIKNQQPLTNRQKVQGSLKLSNVLAPRYGTSSWVQPPQQKQRQSVHVGSGAGPSLMSMQMAQHHSQTRDENGTEHGTSSPHIIHQTQARPSMQQRQTVSSFQSAANTIASQLAPRISPIRHEDSLPRGSRFLTLLDLKPSRVQPGQACLDVMVEVPRLDNLDAQAPLSCLPSGLFSLHRHLKVGILTANELHTEQLLEGVTKLFANYTWVISEITATPSVIEDLFSIDMQDFEDMFKNQMQLHIIGTYLSSRTAERETRAKRHKLAISTKRSMQSNDSIGDGVLNYGQITYPSSSPIQIRSVPKIGLRANNLNNFEKDNSGEENLTDDAIQELENHRVNSAARGSPANFNQGLDQMKLQQKLAAKEKLALISDSPVLKALLEAVPRTPVDFRVLVSVTEARIAMFSNHVPIMRVNINAPTSLVLQKENQMSSFQVGSFQSFFMSEPEMLFAFVKAFNSQMQAIFQTKMLRQEQSLLKLRSLISDQLKIQRKVAKAEGYNQIFNNLADDALSDAYKSSQKRSGAAVPHIQYSGATTVQHFTRQPSPRKGPHSEEAPVEDQDKPTPSYQQAQQHLITTKPRVPQPLHMVGTTQRLPGDQGRKHQPLRAANSFLLAPQQSQAKHAKRAREPLNDPSQNKRGVFQQRQTGKQSVAEESKVTVIATQHDRRSRQFLTMTGSSEDLAQEMDENATFQMLGIDVKRPKHQTITHRPNGFDLSSRQTSGAMQPLKSQKKSPYQNNKQVRKQNQIKKPLSMQKKRTDSEDDPSCIMNDQEFDDTEEIQGTIRNKASIVESSDAIMAAMSESNQTAQSQQPSDFRGYIR